ncbi:hypothetical protein, partial [Mesorhizobium sp.]
MPVAVCAIEERLAVDAVAVGAIELARFALAGDAVALQIAQVRTRPVRALAGELDDPRLDDDPPLPEGGITIARFK